MPHRILIGVVFVACAGCAIAQDTLFFRGFKGRGYFVLSSKSITVKLMDSSWSPDVLAGSYPELLLTAKADRMGPHVFVVQVQDL